MKRFQAHKYLPTVFGVRLFIFLLTIGLLVPAGLFARQVQKRSILKSFVLVSFSGEEQIAGSEERNTMTTFKSKRPLVYIKKCFQGSNAMVGPEKFIDVELEGRGFGNVPGSKYIKFANKAIKMPSPSWSDTHIIQPVNLKLFNYGQKYRVWIAGKNKIGTEVRLSNIVSITPLMLIYQVVPKEGPPGTLFSLEHFADITMGWFGSTQGTKKLMIGNKQAIVVSWKETKITARIPIMPAGDYYIYINDNGKRISKRKNFKVKLELIKKYFEAQTKN